MGQALTSETLSVSGNDGHRYWVGLQAKPSSRGSKKTIYKGVLLGSGPRQWEKVVAKAFTDIPGTKECWRFEVNKADVTKQLAATFAQTCPSEFKIRVVIPGLVQMDKVSKVNRWIEHRHGHRSLGKEDWISIEECIPGRVYRFCPWTESGSAEDNDVMASEHLQTFAHFTYKETQGELVACDFQGITEQDVYVFTDSVIHSRSGSYGTFDEGKYGIAEFFKHHTCTELCKEWPRPSPLMPPPPFEDERGATGAKHVRFDLTPFENIVFHSQVKEIKGKNRGKRSRRRRRNSTGHDARNPEEEDGCHTGTRNKKGLFRRLYPSLSVPEGGPPAYSEEDAPVSRSRSYSDSAHALVSLATLDKAGGSHSSPKMGGKESLGGPRRSCLRRTNSDKRELIRNKDFTPPSYHDLCKQVSTSSSSQEVPSESTPYVTFQLHSGEMGVSTSTDDYCKPHTSTHSEQRIPPSSSGLMMQGLANEEGNNSRQNPLCARMSELKIELPPLKPTAPPLSDL